MKAALESRCLISVYHLPANPRLNLLAYSLIDEQTGIGNARFYCWPANVTLQSFTRYTNGFIAVLSNLGQGWRRKSTTEDCVTRYRPDLTQPTDLISVHEQECDQFEHRTGQIPVSCTRIPDLLAWLNDWKLQEYEYFRNTPFSLGDWINFWLQRVRSDYRR